MGTTQSSQQQIQSAKNNIEQLHRDVDLLQQNINREVGNLEKRIADSGYTNLEEICNKIEYHYVDLLNGHFPIKTLQGYGRIKLGLIPPMTNDMKTDKLNVCKSIVAFYKKKLFLLGQISRDLPACRQKEKEIYTDLSNKLQREGINTDRWVAVYKKIQQFNKDIQYQYTQISGTIEKIREAQTWPQLDAQGQAVVNLLTQTNGICSRYQVDLHRFINTPQDAPVPAAQQQQQAVAQQQAQQAQPVVIQPPVIQPQVIQPPVIQPQVIQPPVIQPQVVQQPAAQQVQQPQVIQPQVVQQPTREVTQVIQQPAREVVVQQPIIQQPVREVVVPQQQPQVVQPPVVQPIRAVPLIQANQANQPVPVGQKAVLTQDFKYNKAGNQSTLTLSKGTEVTVLRYGPRDWVVVRTQDGREGFIGSQVIRPK